MTRALAVVLLLAAAACARGPKFPPPPRDPSIPDPRADTVPTRAVSLRVENRNRADITIYATRGAVRTRLGTVTAATNADLTIPAVYVNDTGGFQLVADPVGGRGSFASPRIVVRSGQHVVWTLESTLARSSVAVF
jgi:hypothetical protein